MPQHPVSDSEVLQIRVCISNRFSGEAHAGPRTSAFFFFFGCLGSLLQHVGFLWLQCIGLVALCNVGS